MPAYNFKRIIKESYGTLLVTALVGLTAGYLLEEYITRYAIMIIIMVPAINDMGGTIGGVLGARLSSALHLGLITPKFKKQKTLGINILASGILGITSFLAIGLIFFTIEYITTGILTNSLKIMTIFLTSGLLLTGILIGVSVLTAFIAHKRGIDPSNVVMPIVSTIGDIGGISSLLIIVHLIGL